MKIRSVTPYAVKGRHWPRFPMVFVEVATDEGLVGVGEALHASTTGLVASIGGAEQALAGQDPFRIEWLWERLFRGGLDPAALSGIEVALWDIVGQACGQPIYNLLGGRCTDKIRVYVDGFFRKGSYEEAGCCEAAQQAVADGFTAIKINFDEATEGVRPFNRVLTDGDLRAASRMFGALRGAVGPDVGIGTDVHLAYDVPSAVRIGHALEEFDLMWIEDPVPQGNMEAMARVAAEVATPVCTGELLRTRYEFRELFEKQAADIVMPDMIRTGGILETKKIAAAADTHYLPIAPHNMVGPAATLATGHLCACIPNFMILEYQLDDVPWIDELITKPIVVRDGCLELYDDAPGLGVALNHAAVEKYAADR